MKKQLVRYINEGEMIPLFYGLVRYDFARNQSEFLPIPLNYIKRFWYWTLLKTKLWNIEKDLIRKRHVIWADGYKKGREVERKQIFNNGQDWFHAMMPILFESEKVRKDIRFHLEKYESKNKHSS